MVKYILCDIHKELCDLWRSKFSKFDNFTIMHEDVRKIKTKGLTAFVSPANSFGFMNGGIDAVYMKMFPGIEKLVQQKIKSFGIKSTLDRYFLPVGGATIVPIDDNNVLICCPTMIFPQNIVQTSNDYVCTKLIFELVDKYNKTAKNKIETVIIPGIGTGVGEIPFERCTNSMYRAYDDFINGRQKLDKLTVMTDTVLNNSFTQMQPNNYANKEVIDVFNKQN